MADDEISTVKKNKKCRGIRLDYSILARNPKPTWLQNIADLRMHDAIRHLHIIPALSKLTV
jgi:hypothetical protein